MYKLKKSEGRKKATYSTHHSAYLEMNWQHILFQNTTMVIWLYLTWETKGLKYSIIISLRPYLEKIKGCRRPDIFRIRPWARHSRIVSGSECVFLCRCTRIIVRFPPHVLTRSCIFRATEAGLNKLFCLFLCLLSSTLCRIKIISFCSLKNGKII